MLYSELSAVGDHDGLLRHIVSANGVVLNGVKDGHAIGGDLSEDDVSAVKMRGLVEAEEELGSVGAWASVGHGEDTTSSVLVDEVLVSELSSVDGGSTSTVVLGEIATLSHEASDDSVEGAALEVEVATLLASAESAEVLGGDGSVLGEIDDDSAGSSATDGDIEEDLSVDHS